MSEGLLAPSGVKLYGRVVTELNLKIDSSAQEPLGCNQFLSAQLRCDEATLARIFGFSYEGHYYDLPKPAIFIVHTPGKEAKASDPVPVDRSGVVARDWYAEADVKVWDYDTGDFSMRLDIETGPFEKVLLEAELRPDNPRTYHGRSYMPCKKFPDLPHCKKRR